MVLKINSSSVAFGRIARLHSPCNWRNRVRVFPWNERRARSHASHGAASAADGALARTQTARATRLLPLDALKRNISDTALDAIHTLLALLHSAALGR